MSTKELSTPETTLSTRVQDTTTAQPIETLKGQDLDVQSVQAERRELARDFVTLKHTISQLRAERDRLAVENRDLQMRMSALETDYANLFSYVEGQQS
ncbi:MAG: hypothetical protein CL849_05690 [Crocinitomicaceae bacterium]|nr:hypothetical protein [Crocinitomicaceae bacterium]